jgi:nuclear GTP-binding protein
MGKAKKEKNRISREHTTKDITISKVKGENFYRDRAKVKKVNMYDDGKPIRNRRGEIVKAAAFQSKEIPNARVEPNRRWFSRTRVIGQDALAEFRERLGEKIGSCCFFT